MDITQGQLNQALTALGVPALAVTARTTGLEISFSDAPPLYRFWSQVGAVLGQLGSPYSVNDLINEVTTDVQDDGVTLTFSNITVSGATAAEDGNGDDVDGNDDDADERLDRIESQISAMADQVATLARLASDRLGVTV